MIATTLHDDVLEIRMDNPPLNVMSRGLRIALLQALAEAQDIDAVKAIVLTGTGKAFTAGADITEFGSPTMMPALPEVVDALEASGKPVVAAIQGLALGGGVEIALGCHYRLAAHEAKFGLPEVNLGLLPGAGGTQRLPRLVGAEEALDMIVSGAPIAAAKAAQIGLVDMLVDGERLLAEAIDFARAVDGPRRTGERDVAADPAVFDAYLANLPRKLRGLDAPHACIDAVRAATELPFREGLAREGALFAQLQDGAQSKALRHVFFAERAAAKIDDLPAGTRARPVASVGVIGAGTMGGGIAMNFLSAGIPVTIVEAAAEALERGVATIRRNYEASAAKGRISATQAEDAMRLLTPTLDFDALGDCDLVIEAAYEDMTVKRDIFARLDRVAKPGALLASNTSYLSIDEIAAATTRPQDVLGMHFFSPANVMKLLEVVRGAQTAPDALATAMEIARRIGKTAVVARVCFGFIGNHMLHPRQQNALALLLEGATPAQIDRVFTGFGMPMGPFQMADLAGVDIGWHRDPSRIDSIADALCAQGRWGRKKHAGFYDYDEAGRESASPVVAEIVEAFRAKAGIVPRAIADEEIVARALYTMINEGAHILEEGIAQRSSDIDVVWVHGYGWPRHTGGPMFWAEKQGLQTIVDGLQRYRDALGADFVLSPLLERSARDGTPLASAKA
ncbi:3-hydroxyacyl-CoA dehydrogenase NAD-binding domain-containing protein [Thermomonas brevis]